jgi:hypothetical protein
MPARAPIGVADDLAEIRHILKRIYDLARDRRTFCRQSIPAELGSLLAAGGLVGQSIWLARRGARNQLSDVTATAWQAGADEVRAWARAARYDIDDQDAIPGEVTAAYNHAHPDRPY